MSEKKWLKIGEAAKLLAVSPKELRYWESVIPQIRPRRSKGNLRYYHREELPRLERIRDWLGEGLTVADCQQLLLTGQLKRGLGLEALAPAEAALPPVRTVAKAQRPSPRLDQARTALLALLERLDAAPAVALQPRRRRKSTPPPEVPAAAPATPSKPARSRRKPAPEPGDPDDFGPLFDQGR